MLSKSSKVTIENQCEFVKKLFWFGFGIQILEINISLTKCRLWTMKNAADLQLETKQEIHQDLAKYEIWKFLQIKRR